MIRRSVVQRWPAVPAAEKTMPRTARSRSADGATTAALLPPSSSSVRPKRAATRGAIAAPIRSDPVALTSATRGLSTSGAAPAASVTSTVLSPSGAPTSRAARSSSAAAATATSGVRSDGFQTTASPHTSAMAVFHAHTAQGKLNAEITPTTPERVPGLHQPVPGPLRGHRATVELAGETHGEVADVDHLLDLAPRLGGDLADLDADQVREVVLVRGQQLAEALDQPAAHRRRDGAPLQERGVRAVDRPLDVRGAREGHRRDGLAGHGADDLDPAGARQRVGVGTAAAQGGGGALPQLGGPGRGERPGHRVSSVVVGRVVVGRVSVGMIRTRSVRAAARSEASCCAA